MNGWLRKLDQLPPAEQEYLRSECGRAIAALEGGAREKDLEFNPYVEYLTLIDFIKLARQGHSILPQEVAQWVTICS